MASAAAAELTDYERERAARIQENMRKMQELGIPETLQDLKADAPPPKKREKRARPAPAEGETRKSSRPKAVVNYSENLRTEGEARDARGTVDNTARIESVTLDRDTAERLRTEAEQKRDQQKASAKAKAARARGPIDSGKGVRVQGGKVYDSANGVTCHWCRQKTLEEHVTCSNANCGRGKRMPLSFCKRCLANRHGEDSDVAFDSGKWVCPPCRGSCGPGCVVCCNCGPCRKKAGLEPTHQIARLARDAGFDNVHDYLVHLVTGEEQAAISARKARCWWGSWLKAGARAADSDASEQTAQEGRGEAEADAADAPQAAAPCAGRAKQKAPPAAGARRAPARGKARKARAAAAPAANDGSQEDEATQVELQLPASEPEVQLHAPCQDGHCGEDHDGPEEAGQEAGEDAAAAESAGDPKHARRLRMMRRMGLAC